MPTRREFLATSATLLGAAHLSRAAGLAPARVPGTNSRLALFEPPTGCYIGAFIERDSSARGNIELFEELTKKKHASYFTYVGYGRPFPLNWVRKVVRSGGAPHIAFEPNDGLDMVVDSAGDNYYLRRWARDAARTKVPIFLRWASEMNGPWTKWSPSAEKYRAKFALVSKIMKEEAPNVAMVWTPFAKPTSTIDSYYPGDEWVDWVGMNIYSVFVHNGDRNRPSAEEDPVQFLDFIYKGYADRKPVHISEYAATVMCRGTGQETVEFAKAKTERFYGAIRDSYPRVKSVNWFCLDTISTGLANNNYSLLAKGDMTATYVRQVSDKHFLSNVSYDASQWNRSIPVGTTIDKNALSEDDTSNDMLLNSAAIATVIDRPFLRGIKNGDVITDDLQLQLLMPQGVQALSIYWKVDGMTVSLSGGSSMHGSLLQRTIPRARFIEGDHTASVEVRTTAGVFDSDEVRFTIR